MKAAETSPFSPTFQHKRKRECNGRSIYLRYLPSDITLQAVRRGCLDYLKDKLADASWKVELWVANDEELRRLFLDQDHLCVMDKRFSFWRSHAGLIQYTYEPSVIEAKRKRLDEFQAKAQLFTPAMIDNLR